MNIIVHGKVKDLIEMLQQVENQEEEIFILNEDGLATGDMKLKRDNKGRIVLQEL